MGFLQLQYRKLGRQQAGSSLYSAMVDTLDTQHAREASQLQSQVDIQPAGGSAGGAAVVAVGSVKFKGNSKLHLQQSPSVSVDLCRPLQVKYKEAGQKELSSSLFSTLPQTLQTEVAKELTELQSQVSGASVAHWF